jgi:hypothetical protein
VKGKPWPKATLTAMRRRYPHEPTAAIAADLGMTVTACYQVARNLGLKKTQEYLNGPHACRLRREDNPGMGTRFQPGLAPHNKGVKGWQAGGRAHETQFKKGRPASEARNYVPIGSHRLSKDGYLERKTTDDPGIYPARRWVAVHRLVWIEAHGPVPPKHVVVFQPGRRTAELDEITLDRIECISMVENMRRNSYHNRYPKEIGLAIQARGALMRKIHAAEKRHHQETTTP